MPAPSVYPAALDDFVTSKVGTDPKTGHADAHNLIGAAIEGMQAEMGLNPSGSWATIKARLDYLWDESDIPAGNDAHVYDAGTGKWVAAKITNAMVDSAAAIGISKLAGYPGDSTKWLRGDGTWQLLPESASVPVGTVFAYAGATAPSGYLLAHGQEILRSTYAALDAVVGTGFGAYTNGAGGPGTTHLRIPDLRGRVIVGISPGGAAGVNAMGNSDAVAANVRHISHRHYVNTAGGGSSSILTFAPGNLDGINFYTSGNASNDNNPAYQTLNIIIKV